MEMQNPIPIPKRNDPLSKGAGTGRSRAILYLFAGVVLSRLVIAALVPIVQDEAYYIQWSQALDWGYFDHPPLIAWVNVTSRLWPSSALMGRLGAMLAAALAFPFMVGLFRRAGLSRPDGLLVALLYANLNVYVFAAGLLTTPDAVQITTWCLALHEGAAALAHDRRRWITAGLAVGLGLLGKYTMVLIGPVFLWGMVRGDPKALRSPWPYVGVVAALLVVAPHLVWNMQHEWVPIRMQLQHGFQGGHDPGFALSTDLPMPQRPAPDGPEARLGRAFGASAPVELVPKEVKKASVESVKHVAEFLGGLLAVWGAFLGVLVHRLVLRLWRPAPQGAGRMTRVVPVGEGPGPDVHAAQPVQTLLAAALWFPILFFAVVSLIARVEGNWAAFYVVPAAALLAGLPGTRVRDVAIHGGVNVAFCLLVALYAQHPIGAPALARQVLSETAGWRELAHYVGGLKGPILTAREQTTSMIRFYQPGLRVAQWPGFSQPSEYVRRSEWNYYTRQSLRQRGGFWLITDSPVPPHLEGFEPVDMSRLTYSLSEGLVVTHDPVARSRVAAGVKEPLHGWYAIHYHVAEASPPPVLPRSRSQGTEADAPPRRSAWDKRCACAPCFRLACSRASIIPPALRSSRGATHMTLREEWSMATNTWIGHGPQRRTFMVPTDQT